MRAGLSDWQAIEWQAYHIARRKDARGLDHPLFVLYLGAVYLARDVPGALEFLLFRGKCHLQRQLMDLGSLSVWRPSEQAGRLSHSDWVCGLGASNQRAVVD